MNSAKFSPNSAKFSSNSKFRRVSGRNRRKNPPKKSTADGVFLEDHGITDIEDDSDELDPEPSPDPYFARNLN